MIDSPKGEMQALRCGALLEHFHKLVDGPMPKYAQVFLVLIEDMTDL